jgi:DNA-binding transcriptional regulator YiaG
MKLYISKKTRQALLDAGFPKQSISNWKSGRHKPSRLSREIINRIITENSPKKQK